MSDTFLAAVEAFLLQHNCSARQFGIDAASDTRFVYAIRNGREPRRNLRERVERFMAAEGRRRAEMRSRSDALAPDQQVPHACDPV